MKTLGIGEIKTHFSDILGEIRKGEKVVISYGKKKEKVAVLVPYDECFPKEKRTIGLLKGKARFEIHDDFKISDEQLLVS